MTFICNFQTHQVSNITASPFLMSPHLSWYQFFCRFSPWVPVFPWCLVRVSKLSLPFLSADNFTVLLKNILVLSTFPKFSIIHKLNSLPVSSLFQTINRAVEPNFLHLTHSVSLISFYSHVSSPSSHFACENDLAWYTWSCTSPLSALCASYSCFPVHAAEWLAVGQQRTGETAHLRWFVTEQGCFYTSCATQLLQLLTAPPQTSFCSSRLIVTWAVRQQWRPFFFGMWTLTSHYTKVKVVDLI